MFCRRTCRRIGPVTIAGVTGFFLGVVFSLVIISSGWLAPFVTFVDKNWGVFPSPARILLLRDGRQVKLLEDFAYIDPRGKAWIARKHSVVNGASIPRAFWTIAGGPFEGQYRNASIVHDDACMRMTEPWGMVHTMFYEACRCGGVTEHKSKLLYAAVYHFGPRWDITPVYSEATETDADGHERMVTKTETVSKLLRATQDPSNGVREKLEEYIRANNPSLTEVEALNPDLF